MAGYLDGLKVVDCSLGRAGPRATGMLADYGAEVIWIEPPGGDPVRRSDPAAASVFNRGKRSVVLDLDKPDDRARAADLAARADVFLESWPPGVAEAMGLGAKALQARNPQLIYCSISGWGADDPRRDLPAHEPVIHAAMGAMTQQAGHREGPIFVGLPLATTGAANMAVIGILAALLRRLDDGAGRIVETSLLDGLMAFNSMRWNESDASVAASGPTRITSVIMSKPTGMRMVTRSFVCGDDLHIGIHTLAKGGFDRLMQVLGLDDRIPPAKISTLTAEQSQILEDNIHRIFAEHPRAYWVKRMFEADICAIEHMPPTAVFDDAQARHNGMIITVDDPVLGRIEQAAPGLRFGGQAPPPPSPARAGQDTAEVLAALGRPAALSRWRPDVTGPADKRALLDGVKILDFGAFYAGPFASRLLADLGADVIKLEPPGGDQFRVLASSFASVQAGKRSLAADFKDEALAPAIQKLIEWADVTMHNLRPGAAERLGLGADDVQAINPDAIYLFSPGWGSSGPQMMRQSFAPMLCNYVGVSYEVAGQYNEPLPPVGNEDSGNGMAGAIAMLIALLVRRLDGRALRCESPQLNAALGMLSHVVRTKAGEIVGAEALDVTQSGISALQSLYVTADGWVCLAVETDSEIAELQAGLGVDILADPRFADLDARRERRDDLADILRTAFEQRPTAHWLETFRGTKVGLVEPAGADIVHDFLKDPNERRLRRVAEAPHPERGRVRELDCHVRISESELPPHRLAPPLGAHSREILAMFGFTPAQIEALRARGAITAE